MTSESLSRMGILKPALSALLCLSCACAADNTEPETPEETGSTETETPVTDRTPAEISETAMDNFVRKLNDGNYTIEAPGFMTTSVPSPDLVVFDYAEDMYTDLALMTLNGETFRSSLLDDAADNVQFMTTDNAVTAAGNRLPNAWMDISDDNMFNLFYNDVNAPLEFTSNDDNVKTTLMALGGYGATAMSLMHEVHMTFDAEDPTTVHFTAVVDDNPVARIYFDDLDMTLRFGDAKSDPRAEAWLKAPVYPEAETEWSQGDYFLMNSVFITKSDEKTLPFPDFASYAMRIDEDVFEQHDAIKLTDSHASEEDVAHYISVLEDEGFTPAEAEDEEGNPITVYRRVLREDYRCCVQAYPHYDNGFVLDAKKYYDHPVYNDLNEINAVIRDFGYLDLKETETLTGWNGYDAGTDITESWLYFFHYDLALYATAAFDDQEAAETYLKAYADRLMEQGYVPDNEFMADSDEPDHYVSPNGSGTFRWHYNDDGTVTLLFRHEKEIAAEEAVMLIADAGIPEPALRGGVTCRNITEYHRMVRGFKGQLYFTVSQPFASAADAERFLDDYTAVLENAGYERTNPAMVGSLRENAYYNEEEDKFVAFDYFPADDSAMINFEFVSNK
ncbi:MAG: hypothetical protein IKF51_01715 [Solobacterium sp.]|nr:hypothetical protein [Solobacterium sp.]